MAVLYEINNKKVLFIHIPKTGGGSIDTVLSKYSVNEPRIVGHPNLEQCLKVVNPHYIFTVVRNPWDWRSSWYYYLKSGKSGHNYELNSVKNMTFKEHLSWINNEPIENFSNSTYNGIDTKLFIAPQHGYINDTVKVLRLENLKSDFENYMSELGLDITFDVHFRKSGNNDYKNEYDEESIKIVNSIWGDDISKFNYKFND